LSVKNGTEIRVSDGQFNLARHNQFQIKEKLSEAREESQCLNVKEQPSDRENLLGSIKGGIESFMESFTDNNFVSNAKKSNQEVSDLSASLGETRDRLNERGEKLRSLADKTEILAESSRNFAKLAKDLEKSQSKWW